MRNRNPQIVEIIFPNPHLTFKCKKCGQIWAPAYIEGGRFHRRSWKCPRGEHK